MVRTYQLEKIVEKKIKEIKNQVELWKEKKIN
jgi:hypothetical protein